MDRPASPLLLAITPPVASPDVAAVAAWEEALGPDDRLVVYLRQTGPDPAVELGPDGRLRALYRACQRAGISMLCGASPGAERHAVEAIDRFGLAGLQLRGDPPATVVKPLRAALPQALLGRSVHRQAQPWADPEVDFTCVAPVFEPRTPGAPGRGTKQAVGLQTLRAWAALGGPILALGGVNPATAADCLAAGAVGLASISTFFGPRARVVEDLRTLATLVRGHQDSSPRPGHNAAPPTHR